MNRRDTLKLTLSFGLLSFFSKFFLRTPSSSSRIDVIFTLPENMSFEEYQKNVSLWVDGEQFKDIQKKYLAEGRLTSIQRKKRGANTLHNVFYFTNDESLMSFLDEISRQCNYNFKARADLGIKTTSYINGQLKNFYHLQVFKG